MEYCRFGKEMHKLRLLRHEWLLRFFFLDALEQRGRLRHKELRFWLWLEELELGLLRRLNDRRQPVLLGPDSWDRFRPKRWEPDVCKEWRPLFLSARTC